MRLYEARPPGGELIRPACGHDGKMPRMADSPQPSPSVSGGRVTTSLPCLRCGYDLRTLCEQARCPECGAPVSQTLAGLSLLLGPQSRLRGVVVPMMVALGALVATAVTCFAPPLPFLFELLALIGGVLALWRLTSLAEALPRPSRADWIRRLGQATLVLLALVGVATLFARAPGTLWPAITGYLFSPHVIHGLLLVLYVSLAGLASLARLRREAWRLSGLAALTLAFWGLLLMIQSGLLGPFIAATGLRPQVAWAWVYVVVAILWIVYATLGVLELSRLQATARQTPIITDSKS